MLSKQYRASYSLDSVPTEDCKLVVTCKMRNRNATDKLIQQCSKLALFVNTITDICGRTTMQLLIQLINCILFCILFCILQVTTNLQSSVSGTLDLVARSGDFFVGVLYWVGVGSDLPRWESPAQIGRVGHYILDVKG